MPAASAIEVLIVDDQMSMRSLIRTSLQQIGFREFREAADAGNTEAAATLARDAGRALDKAASKGVIHANQAANRKSALDKRVVELSSTSAS